MITTERYFKLIETPIIKNDDYYHICISMDKRKRKFIGNFLAGTSNFYYKKNFQFKTLNGLLKKIYECRLHKR